MEQKEQKIAKARNFKQPLRVLIINGANLNLVGEREKNVYGIRSFDDYLAELRRQNPAVEIDYFQSNIEGEIVDALQKGGGKKTRTDGAIPDAIILNAGGYTHTSVVIRDAIKAIETPVIEVHISNISAREEFRHTSLITPVCVGSVMGFGLEGYQICLLAAQKTALQKQEKI